MRRRSSTAGSPATSSPSIVIRPPVGSISRLIIFMVVVLPQPDGPTRTQISPALMVSDRSSTAGAASTVALGDVFKGDHRAPS